MTATATDLSGNVAICQFTVARPFLEFNGFYSPINGSGGACTAPIRFINAGNKVPIKFDTTFCDLAYKSALPPTVTIKRLTLANPSDPCEVVPTSIDHLYFQWVANQWHFNWNTFVTDKGRYHRGRPGRWEHQSLRHRGTQVGNIGLAQGLNPIDDPANHVADARGAFLSPAGAGWAWAVMQSFSRPGPGGPGRQVRDQRRIDRAELQHPGWAGLTRGNNLFHSFSQFDLKAGDVATFSGPANIQNILSRVTGGSPSSIDGTIRSGIAGANFFFINPSGVVFGPNASIDVSGAFAVSTANYLKLADGARFVAALDADDSMLSSAPVAAFGFLEGASGSVEVQRRLALRAGHSPVGDRHHGHVHDGASLEALGQPDQPDGRQRARGK